MNNVSLIGRITADPELKHTTSDIAVTSFSIAINRYAKKGEDPKTDFIDLVAWRGTAEFICRYFKKGQMIAVTGSLQARTYTDRDGNNRKVTEVVVDHSYFCGDKSRQGDTERKKRQR